MMKKSLSALLILLFSLAPAAGAQTRGQRRTSAARPIGLTRFVDPFVGTANSPLPDYLGGNSSGNTSPARRSPSA